VSCQEEGHIEIEYSEGGYLKNANPYGIFMITLGQSQQLRAIVCNDDGVLYMGREV
jgi:hypothetical protein